MNHPSRFLFLVFIFSLLEASPQSVALDPAFGKKGKFYFSNGRFNEVREVVITPEGATLILVESGMMDSIRDRDIVLIKLDPKGIPDPKFGKQGIRQFDFYGMDVSRAGEMQLLSDGKILIAGDGARFSSPDSNLSCLAKLLPDGSPDNAFGKSGTVTFNFHKVSYLTSLHEKDNSIYVAGSYNQPVRSHTDIFPVIGKLNEKGGADSSFGRTGKIWIDFNFEIFSFASVKHTAGGEITDILVLDDGKILVCGGFIFRYTYEGFIARFNTDGSLDKSFDAKGYFRHDFTPGKFNLVKKMVLLDSKTLLFGAASQTDFDSDFYLGTLNLQDFSFSINHIDFKGQHDVLEDISIEGNEIVLSGRSVLPENAALRQQSNFTAIARFPDSNNLKEYETHLFSTSEKFQNGTKVHAVSNERIVAAGFQYGASPFENTVVVYAFVKKKIKKNKIK